ncbi:hypothetical protein [Planktothrix sp. FACHB-1365]|uniref:hypothetical protein n=1 Tax=Planktothrix sp. FACHB-1365 TaxID=2692855 RepID=UPI0016850BCB|nr:hypothetical protein [Planktothrix sp. FACHB-1365]MBD2485047.1 hypothetical protein [Planktothrix sp. FACHB-1365]
MRYLEKDHAQDLYRDLKKKFVNRIPPIICSIKGAGVHWCCWVKSGFKICSIECFDQFGTPEYFISFGKNSKRVATGRTSSKLDTINAVDDWIRGDELSILYKKFSFIDRCKRDIINVYKDLVAADPNLSKLVKIERCLSYNYKLWFESDDRKYNIAFDHQSQILNAAFYGNNTLLFTLKTQDRTSLAKLLKRWICDRALLSQIQTEFPWVEMENLADFYEQENLIEGKRIQSWDSLEKFYAPSRFLSMNNELANLMTELVKSMRKEGYDQYFMASQAHDILFLSSFKKNGDLSNFSLSFSGECERAQVDGKETLIQGLKVTYSVAGKTIEEFEEDQIILTPRIRHLLHQLVKHQINYSNPRLRDGGCND